MEFCEPTSLLLSKIKTFDPENASKILGFLLLNGLPEKDLMRLVLGPDTLLQSLIFKAKSQLGLLSNTSCAPISRPNLSIPSPTANNGGNPFSRNSPRIAPNGNGSFDFDFHRNQCSVPPWSSSVFPSNNPGAGSVSVPPFSHQNNGNVSGDVSGTESGDLIDENQLNEYLSFLNESSKHDDLVDPRVEMELGYDVGTHVHRRSYSASDACSESGDGGGFVAGGFKPCLYFARGFCKNGGNCKFVHGAFSENFDGPQDEIMRLKAVEQQRLAAMSQFGPRTMNYNKYMNLVLQQQNEPRRSALVMQEEFHNHRLGQLRAERSDFAMVAQVDKWNSASRQIYLTFPADSSFKDEDVSEYFGNYGPVQDVRIPYQQKRMFGFVTFVFLETVRLILARGNPHFICDSRVLVKPYKEKGKVPDRRQQLQDQIERGDFSGCISPSEIDDLHPGGRSFYSLQEMMLRRKLEEADLQRAIELQGRRLIDFHLLESKDTQTRQHQRSFSVGDPASLLDQSHNHVYRDVAKDKEDSPTAVAAAQLQLNQEIDAAVVHSYGGDDSKENSNPSENDDSQSVGQLLSDSVLGESPTKSVGDRSSFSTALPEGEERKAISTATTPENNTSLPISLASDMSSR